MLSHLLLQSVRGTESSLSFRSPSPTLSLSFRFDSLFHLPCAHPQHCASDCVLRSNYRLWLMNPLRCVIHRTYHRYNFRPMSLRAVFLPIRVVRARDVHFAEGIKISKLDFFVNVIVIVIIIDAVYRLRELLFSLQDSVSIIVYRTY